MSVALAFAGRTMSRRWLALPVLFAGTFMVILDFFIVAVAVPSLQRDLHAGAADIEWVVAGYGLAYAAGLITGGRLGDLYGRRRVFALGMAVFTLASVACGWAPDMRALIIGRMAQGVGAALLAPQVLAIAGVTYTGAERARAFAIYGVVMGVASACGQVVGGALIQADPLGLGWRACFLVNVPIGAVALALTPALVPHARGPAGQRLDIPGALHIAGAIGLLLLALIEGRTQRWPHWTWLCLGTSVALLAGFARQQRASTEPLIDPALFRQGRFAIGLLTVMALYGGVASFFMVLALYLQAGRGLGPLQSGLVFSLLAGAFSVASFTASGLARRIGQPPLLIGAAIMTAGLLVSRLGMAQGGTLTLLAPGLVLHGTGMGLVMAPLISIVLAGLPSRDAGAAAGVLQSVQQCANALGVALIGVVFFGVLDQRGYASAFAAALDWLCGLAVVLAALTHALARAQR